SRFCSLRRPPASTPFPYTTLFRSRGVRVGIQVGDGRHEVRHLGQAPQPVGREDVVAELELQRGDERNEIQVAAALAVAVDGSLHMAAPGAHRRQGVRHGQAAVVVGVNAEGSAEPGADVPYALLYDIGELPAVAIAQDEAVRARTGRGPQ